MYYSRRIASIASGLGIAQRRARIAWEPGRARCPTSVASTGGRPEAQREFPVGVGSARRREIGVTVIGDGTFPAAWLTSGPARRPRRGHARTALSLVRPCY